MPDSEEKWGRTRLWRPKTIIEWHEGRPGRGRWASSRKVATADPARPVADLAEIQAVEFIDPNDPRAVG